jgi:hypothetical protein
MNEPNNLSPERFVEIRDLLFSLFQKHGLKFKVFGGTVMNLLDNTRGTSDLDMAIQKNMVEVEKLVAALVECDFGVKEEILEGIFGADPQKEEYLFAFSRLYSDNPYFAGFHIDLCFEFGDTIYETIESEECDVNGLTINMATLAQILKMKKSIEQARDRDKQDIGKLEKELRLRDEFSE